MCMRAASAAALLALLWSVAEAYRPASPQSTALREDGDCALALLRHKLALVIRVIACGCDNNELCLRRAIGSHGCRRAAL